MYVTLWMCGWRLGEHVPHDRFITTYNACGSQTCVHIKVKVKHTLIIYGVKGTGLTLHY
jgi:hypothetical protein